MAELEPERAEHEDAEETAPEGAEGESAPAEQAKRAAASAQQAMERQPLGFVLGALGAGFLLGRRSSRR